MIKKSKPAVGVRGWQKVMFRMDPQLMARFRQAVMARGWSMQTAFLKVMTQWVEGEQIATQLPPKGVEEPGLREVLAGIHKTLQRIEEKEALAKKLDR